MAVQTLPIAEGLMVLVVDGFGLIVALVAQVGPIGNQSRAAGLRGTVTGAAFQACDRFVHHFFQEGLLVRGVHGVAFQAVFRDRKAAMFVNESAVCGIMARGTELIRR